MNVALETTSELSVLRAQIAQWKGAGLVVGFVPTMGNLHAGHQSLVTLAREHADRVVASVFVNPTQFGPHEDYARYPRTPQQDTDQLQVTGCDLVWLPSVETMYPYGAEGAVRMRVPGITDVLDGTHRPDHFDGVVTVVSRLFNQVQPDLAVFGCKDYQQLAVIRYLVRDLAFPIELLAAPIVREADGLAMSSRNQYLTTEQRARAPELYRTLSAMREAALLQRSSEQIETEAMQRLQKAGFEVDYAVIRVADLSLPGPESIGPHVALVAARLGSTRLIDNLEFTLG